jgi:Bacterial TniB protein
VTGVGLYSLSRKEGWRRWVQTPPRQRPDQLSAAELAKLRGEAREDYDDARHDWHANFGILRTPQLARIHEELDQIVASNRQDPDRVRGAAVIDALPGLGKTTIANLFARDFDRTQIRRHGPLTEEGHERLPVFRIGLTSKTTLRTLNRMICEFYSHPGTEKASAAQLASYAVDCVLSCETRIGIIDDLHFINPSHRDGLAVSNHLKWLANELPVTFIYAGVGLAKRRLFAEGLLGENTALAQTGRRWTRLELPPFHIATDKGRHHWAAQGHRAPTRARPQPRGHASRAGRLPVRADERAHWLVRHLDHARLLSGYPHWPGAAHGRAVGRRAH